MSWATARSPSKRWNSVQPVVQTHVGELLDRPGRQAVAARLLAGEALALDAHDVVPGVGQPVRSGGACRASADDQDVVAVRRGQPPPAAVVVVRARALALGLGRRRRLLRPAVVGRGGAGNLRITAGSQVDHLGDRSLELREVGHVESLVGGAAGERLADVHRDRGDLLGRQLVLLGGHGRRKRGDVVRSAGTVEIAVRAVVAGAAVGPEGDPVDHGERVLERLEDLAVAELGTDATAAVGCVAAGAPTLAAVDLRPEGQRVVRAGRWLLQALEVDEPPQRQRRRAPVPPTSGSSCGSWRRRHRADRAGGGGARRCDRCGGSSRRQEQPPASRRRPRLRRRRPGRRPVVWRRRRLLRRRGPWPRGVPSSASADARGSRSRILVGRFRSGCQTIRSAWRATLGLPSALRPSGRTQRDRPRSCPERPSRKARRTRNEVTRKSSWRRGREPHSGYVADRGAC